MKPILALFSSVLFLFCFTSCNDNTVAPDKANEKPSLNKVTSITLTITYPYEYQSGVFSAGLVFTRTDGGYTEYRDNYNNSYFAQINVYHSNFFNYTFPAGVSSFSNIPDVTVYNNCEELLATRLSDGKKFLLGYPFIHEEEAITHTQFKISEVYFLLGLWDLVFTPISPYQYQISYRVSGDIQKTATTDQLRRFSVDLGVSGVPANRVIITGYDTDIYEAGFTINGTVLSGNLELKEVVGPPRD